MANYNFRKDLAVSVNTEKQVGEMLEKILQGVAEYNNDNKYDILIKTNNFILTYEVKEDFMCGSTGNVALEFSSREKDSGIRTSQADFYVYKLHMNNEIHFLIHKTEQLKELVNKNKYFRIVNGGDKGSNTLFYLFRYDIFAKDSIKIVLDKNGKLWYNGYKILDKKGY